ncbi:MAG: GatB/YqeY domain-containing protein, partial [Thermoplasmatota archaeon]
MDKDASLDVAGAIEAAGATAVDDSEVDAIIQAAVDERMEFVKERGMGAIGPLMGPVMGQLRGKVDGSVISAKLKAAIEAALQ